MCPRGIRSISASFRRFGELLLRKTDDRGSALVAPQRKCERAADREQQQDEAGDRHRTRYQAAAQAALDAGGQAGKDDRRLDRSDRGSAPAPLGDGRGREVESGPKAALAMSDRRRRVVRLCRRES